MDQVKFVEDKISLGPFFNTLSQMFLKESNALGKKFNIVKNCSFRTSDKNNKLICVALS